MADKKQFYNLWGRSIGQLNQKVIDVHFNLNKDVSPANFEFEIEDTTNTKEIPDSAEIHIIIRRRLRVHRYNCGTKGEPTIPTEIDNLDNNITKFGENLGEAKWQIKFIDPEEVGRNYAWTEPKRLIPKESVLKDGDGNSLIDIVVDQNGVLSSEAWSLNFDDENPTILINQNNPQLVEEFKSMGKTTYLMVPEVFRRIIDKLVVDYCEYPSSPGTSTWQERWLNWTYKRMQEELPATIETVDDFTDASEWKDSAIKMVKDAIEQSEKIKEITDGGDQE